MGTLTWLEHISGLYHLTRAATVEDPPPSPKVILPLPAYRALLKEVGAEEDLASINLFNIDIAPREE